jgi:hypothetical protein
MGCALDEALCGLLWRVGVRTSARAAGRVATVSAGALQACRGCRATGLRAHAVKRASAASVSG